MEDTISRIGLRRRLDAFGADSEFGVYCIIPHLLCSKVTKGRRKPIATGRRVIFTTNAHASEHDDSFNVYVIYGRDADRTEAVSPGVGGVYHAGREHPGIPHVRERFRVDLDSRLAGLLTFGLA